MKKTIKKVFAMVFAALMLMGVMSVAYADEGKPADNAISVSGLEAGDTVNFYQVLKYDETAAKTGGWVNATGFTLTDAEIQTILALDATGKPVTITDSNRDNYGISAALAGKIAQMAQAQGVSAKFKDIAANNDKVATATTDQAGDSGLYVALITPGTADYLYNPVFVSADYTEGGTNSQAAALDKSYSPAAVAKKEQVTLTKEIDGTEDTKYDVNVGDTVPFTITSKVPAYTSSYKEPTYVITDTMEEGLELQGTPVVAIEGITLADSDYSVVSANDKKSFTVTLTEGGLGKVAATGVAQTITVKYSAKVTSIENATVTEKENEATVKFSNNPEDETSYSLLEDKTRNYSFTIDGSLLGYDGTSYETDELIKVGLNADGTPYTETKKYRSGTTWSELAPLQGATFGLYSSKTDAENKTTNYYKNSVFTGTVQSDATGRLKIEGLDAGTYYLRELSAPTGFIADNRIFEIKISAEYTEIEGGQYTNSDGIKVKYDAYKVLKSYQVEVNDGTTTVTSAYSISNKGEVDHKVVDKATYQTITGEDFAGDSVTPINNTRGTELPSTGGMGTTIFYVIGGLLILAAAIVLISRRKVQQ